mgnify:CR=1 FL=1
MRDRLNALRSAERPLSDLQGERRRATILIADVVRSTELAERVLVQHPNIKLLYMSGYTDAAVLGDGKTANGT